MNGFFEELRRRNVFRVAAAYAVVGWLIIQLAIALETTLNLPAWFDTFVTVLILIGFPVSLLFAWAFELTPDGLKRSDVVVDEDSITDKTGRKLDYLIIAGLLGVMGLISYQMVRSPSENTLVSSAVDENNLSIAVLPFEDFSPDKDQEYFASGISEELLNVLARIQDLKVSSRTSAFAFKGKNIPIKEISETLDVAHILEGSVRKSGDTLRITAQLIDTRNDGHMWSETYDRALTTNNIFEIQDEIAGAIVQELKGRLLGEELVQAYNKTDNIEAYELYLRARDNLASRDPENLKKAETEFSRVIELDPNFAPAYAGLADTYIIFPEYLGMRYKTALEKAKPLADKALELAPDSDDAMTAQASYYMLARDDEESLKWALRAIEKNPNNVLARHRAALAYSSLGQIESQKKVIFKALDLDPLSSIILTNVHNVYLDLDDFDNALQIANDNVKWNPDSVFGYTDLAQTYQELGAYDQVHKYFLEGAKINPDYTHIKFGLTFLYLDMHMFEAGLASARSDYQKALIYYGMGNNEKANEVAKGLMGRDKADVLAIQGKYQESLAIYEAVFPNFFDPEKDLAPGTAGNATWAMMIAYLSGPEDNPKFDLLMEKLKVYLETFPVEHESDYFAASGYKIASGQVEEGFALLDELASDGKLFGFFNVNPFYDKFADTPGHKKISAKFENIRNKYRPVMQAQLDAANLP